MWQAPSKDTFKLYGQLTALDKAWHYIMTLATFTLSFFLNQGFATFQSILLNGRRVQGRLNDLNMIAAQRSKRCADGSGRLDPKALRCLGVLARYTRLYSVLLYAGQTRRHAIFKTERGMYALVDRELLTREEAHMLLSSPCRAGARHWIVLQWMEQV